MHPETFTLAFARPHAFGFLAGVALDPRGTEVPAVVLGRLDPREGLIAASLRGFKRSQWVGGRLAARAAAQSFRVADWAVVVGQDGAPRAPCGFTVSIAHKQRLAIALVAQAEDQCLGVDLEDDVTAGREIESLVLSTGERAALDELTGHERDRALVLAFALKEATYKALAKRFDRVLGYHEAHVSIGPEGTVAVSSAFEGVEVQPALEAVYEWHGAQVIAAVRSRWQTPSSTAR